MQPGVNDYLLPDSVRQETKSILDHTVKVFKLNHGQPM